MGKWRTTGRALTLALIASAALGSSGARAADPAWVQRALADQYELSSDVGLRNAPWVGTHNSFNSVAEMGPTLSAQDANQKISLVDQLDRGVRSQELDLHWTLHIPEGFAPVVCHALPNHVGCTLEKALGTVLDEIGGWLRKPANRDQVLLVYINEYLTNEDGYDAAAAILEEKIGNLIHHPPAGGGCAELPYDLTREDVRAAGRQVIVVTDGCGIGAAWPAVAHRWDEHLQTRPFGYADFPDCGPDFTRDEYDSTLVRYWEDATQLTKYGGTPDDGIPPATAAAMARCGVDKIDLDNLVASADPRLEAMVWSWAVGHPRGSGECAVQRLTARYEFGRWFARRCERRRPVACRAEDRWFVLRKPVRADRAPRRCEARGAVHAAPRTGFEVQLLRLSMERKDVGRTLIGYRHRGGSWIALDER